MVQTGNPTSNHPNIIARERNVLRVDFTPKPRPPAPRFPMDSSLRTGGEYPLNPHRISSLAGIRPACGKAAI